ncbi:hypothetical protein Moror_17503 [Moniliophthora roreri MCA 2997]|uniref:Dynamin N-terminal domain-containing protein n=1 Tax=Moniliophthora roreri (strain MCA 2997) TaxID=1381753 RepID=V2XXR6_MONRO|nr:hypothetical protein Moror_17503 [Moniliophthora roreri MCA 2997]
MSFKENMEANYFGVKPEPQEHQLGFTPLSFFGVNASSKANIDRENNELVSRGNASKDTQMGDANAPLPFQPTFKVFQSSAEISYDPEDALKEGVEMARSIKRAMESIQLGSKLRQQVWGRELDNLQKQALPITFIAVCGATGAGKSSILNAVLDDNIVPTSGMRACTAVVTEIAYHDKPTIDADVSFLTEEEWKQELSVLLQDLVDEDGGLKRITDLKSDAGIAWHKVNAVYPSISQDRLVTMSPDQIIALDSRVRDVLGSTKHISAGNSRDFANEIAKYIDSKEKRGKDKKKKEKEKSLMDIMRNTAGGSKKEKNDPNAPAFWPLIRQVNVRCKAPCLSTGAVLVDLPGVADANAARNNIAKAYMKKCQCLWILAPITRAVDDKTARDLLGDAFRMQLMMDGNYDDHAITFIASKTDDISCSEVINALDLHDEPELEAIEEELYSNSEETKEFKKRKNAAKAACKAIEDDLKGLRKQISEHEKHLEAIRNGETFKPTLPRPSRKVKSKKRKNKRGGKKESPKRRRGSDVDDNSDMSDFDDSDADKDESDSDGDSARGSDDESDSGECKDSDSEQEGDDEEGESEEHTEESVKAKIQQTKDAIKDARARLSAARSEKKEVDDKLASLAKSLVKIQKRKNAFCSLKRSEFSKDVLKQDFRTGLKDLDDTAAEQRDPDNFDPTQNLRDYDAINLPVFTCSSRDYVRLTNQVKGDGEPSCFSNVADTGIPELQKWCLSLTSASRARSARMFLASLKVFANSVVGYLRGIGEVTVFDREALRQQWESVYEDDQPEQGLYTGLWNPDPNYGPLFAPEERKPQINTSKGVAPRLVKSFITVSDECVTGLQEKFKDGLEDKCRVGAAQAADAAVGCVDDFSASMHWATFRATLRRHGSFRRDLNVELLAPFTRNIASAWGKVFESDLFGPFEVSALRVIGDLITEIEASAAPGLKDRVKLQGELCLQDAKLALAKTIDLVRETMSTEQKEISRCLAPHVQMQLMDGYDEAMEFRGPGSVKKQKDFMHDHVAESKDSVFDDGADVVMERLTSAAKAIGTALDSSFEELAKKIEVDLSVLWENIGGDDPHQVVARSRMAELVTESLNQIQMWTDAEKQTRQATPIADVVMD